MTCRDMNNRINLLVVAYVGDPAEVPRRIDDVQSSKNNEDNLQCRRNVEQMMDMKYKMKGCFFDIQNMPLENGISR